MKRKFHLAHYLLALVFTFVSCGFDAAKSEAPVPTDTLAVVVCTDSISHRLPQARYERTVSVEFPADTSTVLSRQVDEWVFNVLDVCAQQRPAALREWAQTLPSWLLEGVEPVEDEEVEESEMPLFTSSITFSKLCETDDYVTFLNTQDDYLGGAHGSYSVAGCTFRRADGMPMGWNLFRPTKHYKLQQLITNRLLGYFDVKTIEELRDLLFERDADVVPLPQTEPWIEGDSVVFIYQQYEIVAYAYGLPSVSISLADLAPYLSPTGLRLARLTRKESVK